ncbi:ManX [Desulforapulum autotrophicum HRM2]|uniref:ManX n=1 Tax=Desulforapulum autotrophicum (strain ATCC 43914 / DSM 3382 / VKM B-1955 / HRM2) TaxID=177437 RepID=C0QJ68_DESAH|nr:PTS fructose transporter subunit IIA [Desulforapulum autotrophicum]ACN15881.1 ManX [Desulforapulum autotrophicum HRM2]
MTGILIVTHSTLGEALIETAQLILDTQIEKISFVSIDIREPADALIKKIKTGIKTVNDGKGVIIFTDMFGGTPSNLSYSFLEEGAVEVISGVNLPILLKAISVRDKQELSAAAAAIVAQGKKSISLASGILKGSKRA